MEMLLSSNGLSNESIVHTFDGMFSAVPDRPKLAYISTAACTQAGVEYADWQKRNIRQVQERGYEVEVADLRTLDSNQLEAILATADGWYVDGGNVFFLSYWMEQRGVFSFVQDNPELVHGKKYFGISAGSMIATPSLVLASQALEYPEDFASQRYERFAPNNQACARTLKLVNFLFRPHLNNPDFPLARLEVTRQAVQDVPAPVYVLDDQSALHVTNDQVSVISEGEWHLLNSHESVTSK